LIYAQPRLHDCDRRVRPRLKRAGSLRAIAGFEAVLYDRRRLFRGQWLSRSRLTSPIREGPLYRANGCRGRSASRSSAMPTPHGHAINGSGADRNGSASRVIGVGAFSNIEDSSGAPRNCGHYEGKEVIIIGEMVSRSLAAVDYPAEIPDCVIIRPIGRARQSRGPCQALDRPPSNAYAGSRADVVLVEAARRISTNAHRCAAERVTGLGPGQRWFEGADPPRWCRPAELEAMGFRLGTTPRNPSRRGRAPPVVKRCLRRAFEGGRRPPIRIEGDPRPPSRSAKTPVRHRPVAALHRWKYIRLEVRALHAATRPARPLSRAAQGWPGNTMTTSCD